MIYFVVVAAPSDSMAGLLMRRFSLATSCELDYNEHAKQSGIFNPLAAGRKIDCLPIIIVVD